MRQKFHNLELVQVVRGIASLLVVLFHVTANSKDYLNTEFCFDLFQFGGAGVDIFFVLSGFIITYTSLSRCEHPAYLPTFLWRRFVRIFPTYWIIIGVFLMIQLAMPSFYRVPYPYSFPNLVSTLFLLPGHIMVNGVSWTLTYELFFYLLFSFAFLLPNKKISFILSIAYALFIISLGIAGHDFEKGDNYSRLITYPMNVEFVMGILAAVIFSRLQAKWSMPLLVCGTILFIAAGLATDKHWYIFPNAFNRVLIFGVPSFMIVTGIVRFETSTKKMHVHNFLLQLGEASYSLYLIHLPIVVAVIKIIDKVGLRSHFLIQGLLLLSIIVICVASILFFKWIERPVINRLNAILKKPDTFKPVSS